MDRQDILLRIGQLEEEKYHLLALLHTPDDKVRKETSLQSQDKDIDIDTNFEYKLMFDGGSRGNPGLCGCGYVIYKNDEIIKEGNKVVSEENTNNFAEYMGLIIGLEYAIDIGINNLLIQGDSKLVINHINGTFQCKSYNLIALYNKVKLYLGKIKQYNCQHILRDKNKIADKLANQAMDSYKK